MPNPPQLSPDEPVLDLDEGELAAFVARAPSLRRGTLDGNVVAFTRLLREAGLPTTTGDALDAARALAAVGVQRRDEVRAALAATLVRDPAERPLFDALFEQLWSGREPPPAALAPPRELPAGQRRPEPAGRVQRAAVEGELYAGGEARPAPSASERAYSGQDLVTSRDFSQLRPEELAAVRRRIRALAPRLASALSRRRCAARLGRGVDLRRSMRRAARRHGETARAGAHSPPPHAARGARRRLGLDGPLLALPGAVPLRPPAGAARRLHLRLLHAAVRGDADAARAPSTRRCGWWRSPWMAGAAARRSAPRWRTSTAATGASAWAATRC